MPSLRDSYRRLDERLRALSRARYALTVGALTAAGVLAASALLGDADAFQAAATGVVFTAVYYAMDPNASNATSE